MWGTHTQRGLRECFLRSNLFDLLTVLSHPVYLVPSCQMLLLYLLASCLCLLLDADFCPAAFLALLLLCMVFCSRILPLDLFIFLLTLVPCIRLFFQEEKGLHDKGLCWKRLVRVRPIASTQHFHSSIGDYRRDSSLVQVDIFWINDQVCKKIGAGSHSIFIRLLAHAKPLGQRSELDKFLVQRVEVRARVVELYLQSFHSKLAWEAGQTLRVYMT